MSSVLWQSKPIPLNACKRTAGKQQESQTESEREPVNELEEAELGET